MIAADRSFIRALDRDLSVEWKEDDSQTRKNLLFFKSLSRMLDDPIAMTDTPHPILAVFDMFYFDVLSPNDPPEFRSFA